MVSKLKRPEEMSARWFVAVWVLSLGACSAANQRTSEVADWSRHLEAVLPAIDACLPQVPRQTTGPLHTTFARINPDHTATVRLARSGFLIADLTKPLDKSKLHHWYWECDVDLAASKVTHFRDLPSGTKRLPSESDPSFTRADPLIMCFEGPCMDTRVFAANGELLGYLDRPRTPLPESRVTTN
jgi:hypothetical protein